jgi:hypothetical protein
LPFCQVQQDGTSLEYNLLIAGLPMPRRETLSSWEMSTLLVGVLIDLRYVYRKKSVRKT